jgi:hypothetical protein
MTAAGSDPRDREPSCRYRVAWGSSGESPLPPIGPLLTRFTHCRARLAVGGERDDRLHGDVRVDASASEAELPASDILQEERANPFAIELDCGDGFDALQQRVESIDALLQQGQVRIGAADGRGGGARDDGQRREGAAHGLSHHQPSTTNH